MEQLTTGKIMRKLLPVSMSALPCMAFAAPESGWSVLVPKSSGDYASWIQAIGAIGAIIAAGVIARKQSQKAVEQLQQQVRYQEEQRAKEEKARADERDRELQDRIQTFNEIVTAAVACQTQIQLNLRSREAISQASADSTSFMPEIELIEAALKRIELHLLPEGLVNYTITVTSQFTLFHMLLENIMKFGNGMGKLEFERFYNEMDRIHAVLEHACLEIEIRLDKRLRLRADASEASSAHAALS